MTPRLCLSIVLILALAAIPQARAAPAQTLADRVAAWMGENAVPHASLALLDHGQPAGSFGFGGWSPTEPELIGRLAFTDRLGTLLAATLRRLGSPADPRFAAITIAELLEHRGGLPRDAPSFRATPDDTLDARFRTVLRTKLAYSPGTRMLHSNIGYLTLGMVVQAVTSEAYETACRHEALDPMGVSATIDPRLRDRAPSGGWRISADGYARFLQVFTPQNPVLLLAIHEWLAARPGGYASGYGMGAFVTRTPSGLDLDHTGEVPEPIGGGSAYLMLADGWTAVVIFGGRALDPAAHGVLIRMMRETFGP